MAELGTFIGGAVGPLAVIWLVGTYLSQREELSETRKELARQAMAQEGALKASLGQQVMVALPLAESTMLNKLQPFLESSDQIAPGHRDLGFVARRVRLLTAPLTFYGDESSRGNEMQERGVTEALFFAIGQIRGLARLADLADDSGALRSLVETKLHLAQIENLVAKAEQLAGRGENS